jgi:drug/metabolite transporter (DMT)-like permease
MRLTRLAIATAPALFVLLWSTGLIGARYGLPYIEPLTFLAARMSFAVVHHGRHRICRERTLASCE